MNKKLILTDVDGVLVTWVNGFDSLMLKYGYQRKVYDEYNLSKAFGVSSDIIDKVAEEYVVSDAISKLPPIKNSVDIVRKLHETHGYVFHFVTAISGHPRAHEQRLLNLQELYGDSAIHDLHCVYTNIEKKDILEQYRNSGYLWVEDHAENYELGLELGLNSILMDQPWNQDYKEKPGTRVYTWDQIAEKLENV